MEKTASKQMPELDVCKVQFGWHSLGIATPNRENTMDLKDFDELAGRIEGVSRAVLHLAAALEKSNFIDGPRLEQAWRGSLSDRNVDTPVRSTAHKTLQELALALADARRFRQSQDPL